MSAMTSLWASTGPWNTAIDAIAIDVFLSSSSASTNMASNGFSLSMMSPLHVIRRHA